MDVEKPDELTSADIFEQYRDRIYCHIMRLVHDPVKAEDLTQETFLRVHRRLDTLQDRTMLGVWLYRIATHLCYDRFRAAASHYAAQPLDHASGEAKRVAALADLDAPGLDQVIEQDEMNACIRTFVEGLSDNYRTVIFLHDLQGLSNPEIARMLGCSLATVKIRLHRARQKLKMALNAACDFSYDARGTRICDRKPPDR